MCRLPDFPFVDVFWLADIDNGLKQVITIKQVNPVKAPQIAEMRIKDLV